MSDVKPALTRDAVAALREAANTWLSVNTNAFDSIGTSEIGPNRREIKPEIRTKWIALEQAVAVLDLLDASPFSHDDVTMVREIARAVSFGKLGDKTMKRANKLTALADRIAALLPPEQP